jgi:hypothetical protein
LHPDGATPEGVHDLAGNVSEWTAGPAHDAEGEVRGGSFAAQLATDLRTWRAVRVPASTRAPGIGARCAYDLGRGAEPAGAAATEQRDLPSAEMAGAASSAPSAVPAAAP